MCRGLGVKSFGARSAWTLTYWGAMSRNFEEMSGSPNAIVPHCSTTGILGI